MWDGSFASIMSEIGICNHLFPKTLWCSQEPPQTRIFPNPKPSSLVWHRHECRKVEYHAGELFPRLGFIVTNLETPSRAVVRFYNKRGTAEQWIKEGKQAVKMTRLSCHGFRSNQVRLALSLLAYNLGICGGGWVCREGLRTGP
jgi:hypothetical protein